MAGSYQNFDVLNDNNVPACGFEMEVWGVSAAQLTRIFPSNFNAKVIRYGFGSATDFPGGTCVRRMSKYDAAAGKFSTCTPVPVSRTTVPGDSCWTPGMPGTCATAACEHVGIGTAYFNPTKILYRWLPPDPANPALAPVVRGGGVSSSDKIFSCGNRCYGVYAPGASVTLTAKANSGSTFATWGGACAGNAATLRLSVTLGNPGTVTSTPSGINCGVACTAQFFTGWSGACSAEPSPVCTVSMGKDLSVKANFTK